MTGNGSEREKAEVALKELTCVEHGHTSEDGGYIYENSIRAEIVRSDVRAYITHLQQKRLEANERELQCADTISALRQELAKAKADKRRAFEAGRAWQMVTVSIAEDVPGVTTMEVEGEDYLYETFEDWEKAEESKDI